MIVMEPDFDAKGLFQEPKEGLHGALRGEELLRVPSSYRTEEERIYKEPSPEVQIKFRETTDDVSSANAAGTPDRVGATNHAYNKFDSKNNIGGSLSADGIATKTPSGRDRRVLADSIVIIDDDDDVKIDEELHSDAGSAKSSPRRSQKQTSAFDTVNDDDDDCQILGCRSPPKPQQFQKVAGKKLRSCNFPVNDYRDLSDCEVTMGCQSDIRRRWEEAALRKRVGKPAASKGSRIGKQDGGRASTRDGKEQRDHFSQPPFYANPSWRDSEEFAESVATSTSDAEERPNETSNACNLQPMEKGSNRTQPDSASGDVPANCASTSELKKTPSVPDHSEVENGASKNVAKLSEETAATGNGEIQSGGFEKPPGHENVVTANTASGNVNQGADVSEKAQASQSDHLPARRMDFVADREKMKESAEFIKADEEEWARRQIELEKQAQEAQKLRKRRRAEADRQMEMENRQKQRLEQIRETQLQEMKNTGMKEQIRGQVQMELERKAAGCVDLASLLRRLGISVEGGAHCTPEQVNAAYKKALLRFHPDRAAAVANNDPRLHVEAEETFKLISRLKRTLQPVAPNLHAVRR